LPTPPSGRPHEAGATDFTFYLYNPAEPLLEDFAVAHRAATRVQFEQVADEVFTRFRDS
jgi:hypothetical protein